MSRINFVNQTTTFIGSTQIHPQPGDDAQIRAAAAPSASNPGVIITASYELLDNGIVLHRRWRPSGFRADLRTERTPGDLADDELYTRAQFVAGGASDLLNGQYGSLSLNQNGNWTISWPTARRTSRRCRRARLCSTPSTSR